MSFTVIRTPVVCCSRGKLVEQFKSPTVGTVVKCDECGRQWTFTFLFGWWPVDSGAVAPKPVAPSTPKPGWEER